MGFSGWGIVLDFWGRGVQLIGFWACGVGPSGLFFWGWGSLYKHRKTTLG